MRIIANSQFRHPFKPVREKIKIKLLLALFCSSLFFNQSLFATEYAVISNKKIKSLTKTQIKAIFLKKIKLINDVEVVPVNLSARNPLRNQFEQHMLQMSFQHLRVYWTKQHYLGHRPPINMKSQQSVIALVKKVEGAIAYVVRNNIQGNDINILYTWSD